MARRLGEAFVSIEADTSLFRAQALAGVTKALAGISPEVTVGLDTRASLLGVQRLKDQMTALSKGLTDLKIGVNDKAALAQVLALQGKLKALADFVASITMQADTTKLDAQIAKEEANLAHLQAQASSLKLGADDKALAAVIAKEEANLAVLQKQAGDLNLDARDTALTAKISGLELLVENLQARMAGLDANVDTKKIVALGDRIQAVDAEILVLMSDAQNIEFRAKTAELNAAVAASEAKIAYMKGDAADIELIAKAVAFDADVAASEAQLAVLKQKAADIKLGGTVDTGKITVAAAQLAGLQAAFAALTPALTGTNNALITGGGAWGRYGLGVLTARIALFGGLSAVSGFHLALDAIVETLAVVIPAVAVLAGGLGAFALSAALAQDTAGRVADHLKNVQTVATATGQVIAPLTDRFNQMASVIRPEVFSLYGAAINASGSQLGTFNALAEKTGGVLDTIAARIVVDMKSSGTGVSNFVAAGQRDLVIFGGILQNIGSIIAGLVRVTQETHIAEFLLEGIRAATDFLAVILKLPTPVLAVAIAIHAIYLYSGLAATGLIALLRPIATLASAAGGIGKTETAVAALGEAGSAKGFTGLKATLSDIGTGFGALPGRIAGLGGALVTLFSNPWTWVAVGVIALGALGFWLGRAKDATQQWIDAQNKLIAASTVYNVINTVASSLTATNAKLADSWGALRLEIAAGEGYNSAALASTIALQKYQHQLGGELLLTTGRLAQVAAAFGTQGLAGAEALAVFAGVKISDLLSTSSKVWATAVQKIADVVTGYANMGQGANQLGSDISALTVAGSDQLAAIDKLNAAYDTFTKIVSGPVSGFITFANTMVRFNTDAGAAGASISGLGGAVAATSRHVTTASLQLQSDFQDAFKAGEDLFDAMRASQAPAAQQVNAIKLVVQTLIPLAGTNKAAAAEISALAQEAGGPATTNLKTLGTWAGKVKDPLAALQTVSDNAAIGFANLSLDAQKLGTALSQDLTADSAKAVEAAIGLQGAMNTFAKDITDSGTSVSKTAADRASLVKDLTLIGITGKPADAIINAISGQLQNAGNIVDKVTPQFESFAKNALGLNSDAADKLWRTIHAQNLDWLAGEAFATEGKFVALAKDGLGLTTTQADALWKELRLQYLDTLAGKVDTNKAKWIDLAKSGLDLTTAEADKLWAKLREQQFDVLAPKMENTKTGFEKLAAQMGITKTAADNLWTSLHKVASGSPYPATVTTHVAGTGQLQFTSTGPGSASIQGSTMRLTSAASGAFIRTGTGPTADDVLARVSRGELIVPANLVKAGAVNHLRGMIPGFAAGGGIGLDSLDTSIGNVAPWTASKTSQWESAVSDIWAMAAVAAAKAAYAAMSGAGGIVAYAESFLGKIPYVWGGTSLGPAGADCSGFTQAVYAHFGISAPRTSEAQGAWVKRGAPTPGGLAFYHSPPGGPDPGHVAIVASASQVVSQGGGIGPQMMGINGLPLLWTGTPPGGFPGGAVGQAPAGVTGLYSVPQLEALWNSAGGNTRASLNMADIAIAESGGNPRAYNSSGASGLWQILGQVVAGNIFDPYVNALNAVSKYNSSGYLPWVSDPVASALIASGLTYAQGGLVAVRGQQAPFFKHAPAGPGIPGMAAGGPFSTVAAMRAALSTKQAGERAKYFGLEHSFAIGPASGRTKLTVQELLTLATRQAVEQLAYAKLAGTGLTKSNLGHFGVAVSGVDRVARDKELNRSRAAGGHPAFIHDLRGFLHDLTVLSGRAIPSASGLNQFGGTINPAWKPGNLGSSYTVPGGVLQFDRGGSLRPGFNPVWNGTGRTEHLTPTDGTSNITLEFAPGGGTVFEQFMFQMIQKFVRVRGGGNVQTAFGRNHPP